MKRKVLIIDTSILCVWLEVKWMEDCGSSENKWTFEDVQAKIELEIEAGTTFVLPFASIIETGNHIAQLKKGPRKPYADKLIDIISQAADNNSPWAAFTEQSGLWSAESIRIIAAKWGEYVESHQSLGDALIVNVADYYYDLGYDVEIFTGDEGLKAYEPVSRPVAIPRRRQK